MGTFLEFYQALLKFVNYKLFSDVGMKYPLENPQNTTYLDVAKTRKMQQHISSLFT